ncbi:MAG: hypothetical protein JWR80_3622 [Bradyrhizobium sp.]|nr:hypothetical protein [Bradyrhizobium sp.]
MTNIKLAGRLDGWDVARVAREIDPDFPINLHNRGRRRSMARPRSSKQPSFNKTVRASAACDSHF